jgi:hypothetical protein
MIIFGFNSLVNKKTTVVDNPKIVEILLIKDNPKAILLTSEALKEGTFPNNVHFAFDRDETTDLLLHAN